MYVIVMKSKYTDEIFGVERTLSSEPCRFIDYATAERVAHEKNQHVRNREFVWTAKKDDGIYFKIDNENYV